MPMVLTTSGPVAPLTLATLLLLAAMFDVWQDRKRPLWLRFVVRVVEFAVLTWLLQIAVRSPVAPQLDAAEPGIRLWAKLIEIGWWMLGARVAVGIVRLVVVLENQPRETKIAADLLAGAIYIATALAVINFVIGVAIAGLVATSGVVAIILGLALQTTLSDVFSGIAIGLERAYKPGDLIWVEGGIEGQVLQVNWRSTQIVTLHDSIAIVPNSVIAKSRLENRSAPTPTRSLTITVCADPSIEPGRCIAALNAAALACQLPLREPAPVIGCISLNGDGNVYEVSFAVGASLLIPAARTEILGLAHRHLRYAGITLGVSGLAPPTSASVPTLAELMAASDVFGPLTAEERGLFAEHFVAISREQGETLLREGEMPDVVYLLGGGTVELTRGSGVGRLVVLRASPGDSVGMMALITGSPLSSTATALTPVTAYSLDKDAFAAVLRIRPGLARSLEAQAKRGHAWLRCEVDAHEQQEMAMPEMLLDRLREFLHRLNT
jgi:small-conductance mechanosensitive channel/CRP-like cAMP-binding protein